MHEIKWLSCEVVMGSLVTLSSVPYFLQQVAAMTVMIPARVVPAPPPDFTPTNRLLVYDNHLVFSIVLLAAGGRVPTPNDGDDSRLGGLDDRVHHALGACLEGGHLEDAHGTVPDDRLGRHDDLMKGEGRGHGHVLGGRYGDGDTSTDLVLRRKSPDGTERGGKWRAVGRGL